MGMFDYFIAFLQGIVEGITEWLPISSTGHLILVENMFHGIFAFGDADFTEMFRVVIQLGAIFAVVLLFWKKIFPFDLKAKTDHKPFVKKNIMMMWVKILVASVPAGVVGVLFDDAIDSVFYKPYVVAAALIVYGVLFILVENWNQGKEAAIQSIGQITYKTAVIIGVFQLTCCGDSRYIPFGCDYRRCLIDWCVSCNGNRVYLLSCNTSYAWSKFT